MDEAREIMEIKFFLSILNHRPQNLSNSYMHTMTF